MSAERAKQQQRDENDAKEAAQRGREAEAAAATRHAVAQFVDFMARHGIAPRVVYVLREFRLVKKGFMVGDNHPVYADTGQRGWLIKYQTMGGQDDSGSPGIALLTDGTLVTAEVVTWRGGNQPIGIAEMPFLSLAKVLVVGGTATPATYRYVEPSLFEEAAARLLRYRGALVDPNPA